MATLTTTDLVGPTGYSFMDAETMGGDELRSLTVGDLCFLLAGAVEGKVALLAEIADHVDGRVEYSWRELRARRLLVARAEKVIGRLHYYVGAAAGLEELMTERGYSGE